MKNEMKDKLIKILKYDEDKECVNELIDEIEVFLRMGTAVNTNQAIISFAALFQGFIVRNWSSVEFSSKFEDYNRIIVKYCVCYYRQCWEHRNSITNDEQKQAERIRTWYAEEFREVQNNSHLYIARFINTYKVDPQNHNPKVLKKWIFKLKKFKLKLEICAVDDIR